MLNLLQCTSVRSYLMILMYCKELLMQNTVKKQHLTRRYQYRAKINFVALCSLLLLNSRINPYVKMRFSWNVMFLSLLKNPSILQIKDVNELLHIHGDFT